jgi:hypothetical protein
MEQRKTFYVALQNAVGLDLRDKRGKKHDLGLVLLELSVSLLRKRDGCLSSLHRSMVNTHNQIINVLGIDNQTVISRSHLPVLLKKVDVDVLESLLFEHYGIKLNSEERTWFSCDGKELRGSILSGDKRGGALVQIVRQSDKKTYEQSYYNGAKESEKPCLRELLKSSGANSQKVSMDALHLCPLTISPIAKSGGIYLVGLKKNQKLLLADMIVLSGLKEAINTSKSEEKGHGRLEKRQYWSYDIEDEVFDERWAECDFRTLIKVERVITDMKTQETYQEIAYYISNQKCLVRNEKNEIEDRSTELFGAVRGHWSVEASNYVRDVTFKEDNLRTKKTKFQEYCRHLEHW